MGGAVGGDGGAAHVKKTTCHYSKALTLSQEIFFHKCFKNKSLLIEASAGVNHATRCRMISELSRCSAA